MEFNTLLRHTATFLINDKGEEKMIGVECKEAFMRWFGMLQIEY